MGGGARGWVVDISIEVSEGETPRPPSDVGGFSLFTRAIRCRGAAGSGWGGGGGGPLGFTYRNAGLRAVIN